MYYDERTETIAETPVKLEPWQQRLLDAANIIRKRGWCQGHYQGHNESVCIVGAIHIASSGSIHKSCLDRINEVVISKLTARLDGRSPIAWNDKQGRTKDEVLDLLESVAKGE
jgi:hypothetical protein